MIKRTAAAIMALFVSIAYAQTPPSLNDMLQKVNQAKDSNKVKAIVDVANYYLGQSKLDSNKFYLNQALAEAEKSNYTYGKARVLFGLGNMYRAQGEYDKALELFHQSLKLRTEMKLPLEAAAVEEAIGRTYIFLEKPEKAIVFFNNAKAVYESHKDSARLVPLFSTIGDYYATGKDYESGLTWYKKALDIYDHWEATKNFKVAERFLKNYKSNTLTNYAFCLTETGKAEEAITLLEPLLEERKKLGGMAGFIQEDYLGYAYLKAGNYRNSIAHSEAALKQIKDNPGMKLLDEVGDINRNLSEAYHGLGDNKNAYTYFRAFKEVNDSMNNEKASKAIAEMQTKYETEKKDGEIVQLTKDKKTQKTIIALAAGVAFIVLVLLVLAIRSRRLQQKLFKHKEELMQKEKEIEKKALEQRMTELEQMALRAQMNPHFIFNSLNSVQHFVMNKDVEGVNKYLGIFAKLVRQTLDNSGKALIPLNEEIKYIESYLSLEKMKSNNRFDYTITVNNNIDPFGTFIPGMILQPFIENSILHGVSHKEKNDGLVKVNISRNGKLVCLIDDNGIGRQRSAELKTVQAEYESKGMDITMHRIEVINKMYNSSISVQFTDIKDDAGNPSGTSVKVELPADME